MLHNVYICTSTKAKKMKLTEMKIKVSFIVDMDDLELPEAVLAELEKNPSVVEEDDERYPALADWMADNVITDWQDGGNQVEYELLFSETTELED